MYDNVFYKNLSKDKNKLEIFKNGIKKGQIKPFDVTTLSHLRRLYFSCYSALLYLYGEETNSKTISNKLELLSFVFEKEKYTIVHAKTDSTRDIVFSEYNHQHLDYNSYIEVTRGRKTYVYDSFSMLMFDKDIYEKLEHPEIIRTVTKERILSLPARDREDYNKPHDIWLAAIIIPQLENNLDNNPYKDIIRKELQRYKTEINYEDAILEWRREELGIYKKRK